MIEVNNIAKKYQLGMVANDSIVDSFRSLVSSKVKSERHTFWALKDISFNINEGEVVGIVGRNGAGKSTLLKVLSRITYPTHGQIKMRGRVASLLEVGTGFHPELSGKENIFLNGAILGMKRREIKQRFDEIVDFSGVSKFIDTPVKRYSSGMYVRLAFSVAAHLEPEILIIDEVLAVGDASFQKKCLGKMQNIAGQGRTVLFVSHNMAAVNTLCSRCLFLEKGKLKLDGTPSEVVHSYIGNETSSLKQFSEGEHTFEEFTLSFLKVYTKEKEEISRDDDVFIEVGIEKKREDCQLDVTIQLANEEGQVILISGSGMVSLDNLGETGTKVFRLIIPRDLLNEGNYNVNVLFVLNRKQLVTNLQSILSFNILPSEVALGRWMGKSKGYIKSSFHWEMAD